MKYEDYKITEGMLADKGVISLPDTPAENTPAELKAKFDELAREVIIPQFNTLMDLLDAGTTEEGEALGEIVIKIDNNTDNIEKLEMLKQDKLTAVGPLSIEVNEEEGTTEIKVDLSDYVTKDDASDSASMTWVREQGYAKDSDIPEWAKAEEKPTYTAEEVGALPDTTYIPTKTSDLENDSKYVTRSEIPTKISQLQNDSNYATKGELPTNTSQLTNDSGFLTEHQDISGKQDKLTAGKNITIEGNEISAEGTTVEVNALYTSGKHIADITVDGEVTEIYAPESGGGGGGTAESYNSLNDKPSINGVTLEGNKTLANLGIASQSSVDELAALVGQANAIIEGVL